MAQSASIGTVHNIQRDKHTNDDTNPLNSTMTSPSPPTLPPLDLPPVPFTAEGPPLPTMTSVSPPHVDGPGSNSGSGDDEDLYGEDDAQSFIQPAMSPAVTRLTSPRTPAAERVAAMDQVIAGYFDASSGGREDESSGDETPKIQDGHQPHGEKENAKAEPVPAMTETAIPSQASIPPPQPQTIERLPSPWRAGPKEIVVTSSNAPHTNRPFTTSALAGSRHRRSSSTGTEVLRRLSKALPSLSLPSNFTQNRLSTSSFFSIASKPDLKTSSPVTSPQSQSPRMRSSTQSTAPSSTSSHQLVEKTRPASQTDKDVNVARPPSSRSLALRRSTSDESILYHSLSRMSSFGDDQRFTRVREQVNSRFKAIRDSFDPPSFRLPTIPSTLSLRSPLKKSEFTTEEITTSKGPKDPLDTVLESLTGDLVIMGGYRGSVLRSAEPPHRQLWVPIKVGLNVRKVNLEVGLELEDEERMSESIIPSGMLKNIGPIDIAKRLFKRVRECENVHSGKLRVHDYGYDWRLSPHRLSRQLVEFLRTLPSNQGPNPTGAFVVAHSLGGVITRHAVNQAPHLFSGVVYAGAPQRCINILGPLRNGDAVLLNEKVLTAHVNFSLRSTFVFLPEDGFCFIDKATNKPYSIDFFNAEEWVRHRLCPSAGPPALPPFANKRVSSGLGSFLSLPDSLSSRARSSSDPKALTQNNNQPPAQQRNKLTKDRTLAPQMDASSSSATEHNTQQQQITRTNSPPTQARSIAYLTRTLAEIKQFRAELQHKPQHQAVNAYPPIAVIYGKEIPTVWAARVACREAIACSDCYDDLVFRSGDGVVLAREAMPPPGYEIAKGGRISTDKGHISILGDLNAVGRAMTAVVRGRSKGIGLGQE